MIEEARVPEWMLLLTRMTRRRLRLASRAGYSSVRPFPSWRNRIAEFLPPPRVDAAPADQPRTLAIDPETSLGELANDPLLLPASWAELAAAEVDSQQSVEVAMGPSLSRADVPEPLVTLREVSVADDGVELRIAPSVESAAELPAAETASTAVDRSVIVPVFVVQPPVVGSADRSPAPEPAFAPVERTDYNLIGLNYRRPMPRPKVNGFVVDFHCHLLAARHAPAWFEAADHYGIDCFVTMTPLEEAAALQRDWGDRLRFIAVPTWGDAAAGMSPAQWVDDFLVRVEAFHNLGCRIVKFHAAPGTMALRGIRLDSPLYKPLFREVVARKMGVMTHIGDPELWYHGKYGSTPELAAKFGTRDEHYQMWEGLLEEYPGVPWIGAHLGGNPEDPGRLQGLLDRFPDLWLDNSATRWMAREVSQRRDVVREFFIRNRERLLFGTDQVSTDDRGFDFLASRLWSHRKLWETAYAGPGPIADADLPPAEQPMLRGLALPDQVLQSLYHDNAVQYLAKVGAGFEGWG